MDIVLYGQREDSVPKVTKAVQKHWLRRSGKPHTGATDLRNLADLRKFTGRDEADSTSTLSLR